MNLSEIQNHVRELATLEETENAVLSCYLGVNDPQWRNIFEHRMKALELGLTGRDRSEFEDSKAKIEIWLTTELVPHSRGVALFCREGKNPFFLPLQFSVPLPSWISRSSTPNIYHLVELKDTYHRYVLLLLSETNARILEINLGTITERLWAERKELRERVGREWTKRHYQLHRTERTRQFIREIIRTLEKLMLSAGHTHLIIAGKPHLTGVIQSELPQFLRSKLIDIMHVSASSSNVIAETLRRFVECEERESQEMADLLFEELTTGGLATGGPVGSFRAVQQGQADVLVMSSDFDPGIGVYCPMCLFLDLGANSTTTSCVRCLHQEVTQIDVRQELVRIAEQQRCKIEIVNDSKRLKQIGSVGCLLRYWLPDYEQWG